MRHGLDQDALGAVIQADPRFGRNMQQLDSLGRWAMQLMGGWLADGTIGHMLHNMNRPEAIELAHMPYRPRALTAALADRHRIRVALR